ncbi:MAG: branched-chain amino acid aminotransferase [Bacteroidia bacterium]|nr:branched-chain amino acid aminotransferase [Bacteroidia bacterium]
MSNQIKITRIKESNISNLDFNNIPLGTTFTDHMFMCDFENGSWVNPRIEPLHLIPTHPAAMALHYGQAIFEGMKATIDTEGNPMLFRPEENAARLNFSARRMGMPELPEELFIEGLKQFVGLEKDWIPPQDGSALYLRPFMYADEAFIGMRAATHYKFVIMASPSAPLFSTHIKLWAEKDFIRAAHGGTGEAKAAGNYAAAIKPTELAKNKGYDQVLWLDAAEHKYIQEVGTMNIFFKVDGMFITPKLDGSVLSGITRKSVIDLLRDKGFEVTERLVSLEEIRYASDKGLLEEAFGTGTAVGIAYIKEIGMSDGVITISEESPVAKEINATLQGIKTGKIEDTFNWMTKIENQLA